MPSLENLKFSFEFYDCSGKYCISDWKKEDIQKTLGCLGNINTKSFSELSRDRRVYHFFEVDWKRTIEKRGFPNPRINNLPPFHFALIGVNNQKARVYGAYSGQSRVFYIVWFDLEHKIWPTEKRNTH